MSETKTDTAEEAVDYQELVKGHEYVLIEDEDGSEYRLRYTRATVKAMEKAGVNSEAAAEMLSSGTLTGAEDFVLRFIAPAFRVDRPKMTDEQVLDVWESVGDKQQLIGILIALFSRPVMTLITNPTKTRAKFRLV